MRNSVKCSQSDEVGGSEDRIVLVALCCSQLALALDHRKLLLGAGLGLQYAPKLVHLKKSVPVAEVDGEVLHVWQDLQDRVHKLYDFFLEVLHHVEDDFLVQASPD